LGLDLDLDLDFDPDLDLDLDLGCHGPKRSNAIGSHGAADLLGPPCLPSRSPPK
jgi:hypothetical protein